MPDRIPTYQPPWINRRPRRRDERPSAHARGYGGRGWMLARRQALARDGYQCRACGQIVHGRRAHVDHITPKAQGGSDLLENLQTLCATCHQRKTNAETVHKEWSALKPEWVRKPLIPITLVCGPPASGKSTYVREHAKKSDKVIDLDRIASRIAGSTEHGWPIHVIDQALQERNKLLDSLANPDASCRHAWFIVCEPDGANRRWWAEKINANVVVLETAPHICEGRIALDPERWRQFGAADNWWSRYSRSPTDTVIERH